MKIQTKGKLLRKLFLLIRTERLRLLPTGPSKTASTFSLYPSVTDWGRVRADLRSTFRLELVSDLFWALELYATYDTDPPREGAEDADYGVVTSLGWSL